jgi:hypothetical protein
MSIGRSAGAALRPAVRPRARFFAAIAAALLLGAPAISARADGATVVHAKRAGVRLAEVSSRVDPAATSLTNVAELLRSDVEAELAAIDWKKEGVQRSYLVSASVVRLDSDRSGGAVRVSCAVSATIRDAERGAILAMVEGRARAEEGSSSAPGARREADVRAERGALSAAAHGAVSAIPEAIRRAP